MIAATWNEIDEVIAKYTTVDMAAALLAYKKDAERYRWLRERPSFIGWDFWNPPVPQEVLITPEFMDSAIDEALNRVIDRTKESK